MEKYYNKLSDNYDALYIKNIKEFQKNQFKINKANDYYVDFYPSFGIRDSEMLEFLVYGQAVNGWGSGFSLNDSIGKDKLEKSIICSNEYLAEKNHTPIDWVNIQWSNSIYKENCKEKSVKEFYEEKYKACRSFFWNVTYKLICDYYKLNRSFLIGQENLYGQTFIKLHPKMQTQIGLKEIINNLYLLN